MDAEQKLKIIRQIEEAIESIRPYLIADGGNVDLLEITDDLVVKVKLIGACDGCPFSMMTLKAGIEQAVRKKVPEIKELVAVQE